MERPGFAQWLRALLFIGSAAVAGICLRLTWDHPRFGLGLAVILTAYLVYRTWSRRRFISQLERGEIDSALKNLRARQRSSPHSATMAPLMTATALAAYGRVREARQNLAAAARGPMWEAAREQRLFVDVLLSTFEGDNEVAREKAAELERLPIPHPPELKKRVASLREAMSALARAFSHEALPQDLERLVAASATSPLVHWAMRYAAAVVAIDAGDHHRATRLIENAPDWPEDSTFRAFQQELVTVIADRSKESV